MMIFLLALALSATVSSSLHIPSSRHIVTRLQFQKYGLVTINSSLHNSWEGNIDNNDIRESVKYFNENKDVEPTFSSSLDNTDERNNMVVGIRFSPLVGGPRFLPIHVEVLLFQKEYHNYSINKKNKSDSYSTNNNPTIFHRFDFLPLRPTQIETTMDLVRLRFVEGLVRYRKKEGTMKNVIEIGTICFDDNDMNNKNNPRNKSCDSDGVNTMIPVVEKAIEYCETYRSSKNTSRLHLIRNNCFTFALGLLNHLNIKINFS